MFVRSRELPVREADNLTAVSEPSVWTVWDSHHLTNLQASTAYYGDS
jgi:hypothetical protein